MSTSMPTALAGGRYQLGQLIGRGGMAEVHVALDTRLGRTVAVKIMRADLANDDIFLARFRREAHAVAQMNNPNIVNIYDSGEELVSSESGDTERLPYIVMEYVKGQTLRDIIKVNGALSQRDCEQVMLGVLNALDYSHRMGIIHRDIKPGNIMISEQGVVKVMDFGIARALDDSAATMTQSQGVVGTAQYLSPEQARGETVDMRSDLYSAGCVLYEMLTGRPPFTGDSAVAIAYQHVSEVATPPSAVVPGLPKMWDSICAKAMAKDRQNRYATASEFKTDILTYMNGGVPVAAAFNPLTDLSNMKARKEAERDLPTTPVEPHQQPTQAFNPVTGQFEQIPPANGANSAALQSRAQQRAAAGGLAGRLGRGRAVCDHGRPGEAQPHRRRYRRPHVLAQLHAEAKRRHLRAGEHQPRAERHVRPTDGHAARPMVRRRGGKAALFREHVVVRQPRLRHDAEDAPAVQHGRAVVELAPGAQRHAEHDDGVAVLRVRTDVQQRFFGRIEQQRGQKQVAARVARHAQLRQHEQRSTRPVRLVDARADRRRVAPGVCHGHGDGRRRRAQETVLHGHSSLLGQYAQKARKKPRAHFSSAPPRGIIQYNMCAYVCR